ncbi:DUF1330 domain-containing protein [Enterobacter ludwigii]|uniref:DUF1330 domain-containing protein n=1 Tax=Enterobacter ludwigii TaxID=299767 RepID=UPI003975E46B
MNKGYLIAHVTVTDPAAYAEYANAAGEALQGFNPRVIVWSGEYENLEGEAHERHVVLEFDSYAEAKRFYNSPGYVAARKLRARAATGTFVVVEGV